MRLGNLTVAQMEKRLGIEFTNELQKSLEETRQDSAQFIKEGCWHCFDIPFEIVCGDMGTAQDIYDCLKSRSTEVREPLQFSIQQ